MVNGLTIRPLHHHFELDAQILESKSDVMSNKPVSTKDRKKKETYQKEILK